MSLTYDDFSGRAAGAEMLMRSLNKALSQMFNGYFHNKQARKAKDIVLLALTHSFALMGEAGKIYFEEDELNKFIEADEGLALCKKEFKEKDFFTAECFLRDCRIMFQEYAGMQAITGLYYPCEVFRLFKIFGNVALCSAEPLLIENATS